MPKDNKDVGTYDQPVYRMSLSYAAGRVLAFEALIQRKTMKELASEIILNNCSAAAFKGAGVLEEWVEDASKKYMGNFHIEVPTSVERTPPKTVSGGIVVPFKVGVITDEDLLKEVNNNLAIKNDEASKQLIARLRKQGNSGSAIARMLKRSHACVNEYIKKNKATLDA
jgi:hypothetical protein